MKLSEKIFELRKSGGMSQEYQSDNDLPKVKEVKTDGIHQIMILLVTLEVMSLVTQFITIIVLPNVLFGLLSFIPFIAMIGGFEYAYQKKLSEENERTTLLRKKFYKISVWLGTYFPIRLAVTAAMYLYPRPYYSIVLECIIFVVYIMTATLVSLGIEKRNSPKK